MPLGRPLVPLVLTPVQHEELKAISVELHPNLTRELH